MAAPRTDAPVPPRTTDSPIDSRVDARTCAGDRVSAIATFTTSAHRSSGTGSSTHARLPVEAVRSANVHAPSPGGQPSGKSYRFAVNAAFTKMVTTLMTKVLDVRSRDAYF